MQWKPITSLLMKMNVARDSKLWPTTRILAVIGLIASGSVDLPWLGEYLAIPLSVEWAHRITAACIVFLWLAGKYDTSPLPSKQAIETQKNRESDAADPNPLP